LGVSETHNRGQLVLDCLDFLITSFLFAFWINK
jgi:hypothetical protein